VTAPLAAIKRTDRMADQKAAAAPPAKAADPKKDAKKEAAKKEKAAKKAAAAAAGAADGKKTDQKKEAGKQRKAKVAKSAAATAPVAAADTKHTVDGKEVKAPYLKKVVKAKGETVTEVDAQVARALLELEAKDLAAELTDLFITAARRWMLVARRPWWCSCHTDSTTNTRRSSRVSFASWRRNCPKTS